MSDRQWKHQLDELKIVLSGWEQKAALTRDIETGPSSDLRDWFPVSDFRGLVKAIDDFVRHSDKSDDRELGEHFLLPAISADEPVMFPVGKLVLKVREDALHIGLRVAVFYDHSDLIHARGWRFESADDPADGNRDRFHHFPHVQRITSWAKSTTGLHPPSWMPGIGFDMAEEGHVHEIRPAFPLRGQSPAGIAVAAMASLYGSTKTLEYLEGFEASCSTCRLERVAVLCHDGVDV